MCMEDVRLGRETKTGVHLVEVTGATQGIIGPNPLRVCLVFCQPDAGSVRIVPTSTAVAGQGVAVFATGRPEVYCIATHGALVTDAWQGIGAGAASMVVLEVVLAKQ